MGFPEIFPIVFNSTGKCFVIEGDEYDTAFFDKHSKFLHYHPNVVILNNLEFDHADIFDSLDAIKSEFRGLLEKVSDKNKIIANANDPEIYSLIQEMQLDQDVTWVRTKKDAPRSTTVALKSCQALHRSCEQTKQPLWEVCVQTNLWGELRIETTLAGDHNAANITQVVACLESLSRSKQIMDTTSAYITAAIREFKGVARRLEHLGTINQIDIFEDFAHHPTAVGEVINGIKNAYPDRRLIVAFEPKNATSRRNIFSKKYAEVLGWADVAFLGACPDDKRVAASDKMDTQALARLVSNQTAKAFDNNDSLLEHLVKECRPDDIVVFMSSGSFSGIQHKILQALQ